MTQRPATPRQPRFGAVLALTAGLGLATQGAGCMALTPQLQPTDHAAMEQVEDREERERLYAENQIYRHNQPQGMRYTKGTSTSANKRSWQSLDAILRSDANSAAALPVRQQRLSRLFTALTIVAGIVTVAGAAASAREGLNLGDLNGTGGLMLGGGLATLGFGIASGVFYGKTRKGYEKAVDIYNDSLGMRLGILDGEGKYVAPRGSLVDKDGFVVLDPADEDGAPGPAEPPVDEDVVAPTDEAAAAPADDAATPEVSAPTGEAAADDAGTAEAPDDATADTAAAEEPAEAAAPDIAKLDLRPRRSL